VSAATLLARAARGADDAALARVAGGGDGGDERGGWGRGSGNGAGVDRVPGSSFPREGKRRRRHRRWARRRMRSRSSPRGRGRPPSCSTRPPARGIAYPWPPLEREVCHGAKAREPGRGACRTERTGLDTDESAEPDARVGDVVADLARTTNRRPTPRSTSSTSFRSRTGTDHCVPPSRRAPRASAPRARLS
jgi:hypothetical protein